MLDYGFGLVDRPICGSLAPVISESIWCGGGVLVVPDGYIKAVEAQCEAPGMLLIRPILDWT